MSHKARSSLQMPFSQVTCMRWKLSKGPRPEHLQLDLKQMDANWAHELQTNLLECFLVHYWKWTPNVPSESHLRMHHLGMIPNFVEGLKLCRHALKVSVDSILKTQYLGLVTGDNLNSTVLTPSQWCHWLKIWVQRQFPSPMAHWSITSFCPGHGIRPSSVHVGQSWLHPLDDLHWKVLEQQNIYIGINEYMTIMLPIFFFFQEANKMWVVDKLFFFFPLLHCGWEQFKFPH